MKDPDPLHRRYCVDPSSIEQPREKPPSTGIGVVFDWLGRLLALFLVATVAFIAFMIAPIGFILVLIIIGWIGRARRKNRAATAVAVQLAVRAELDRRDALSVPNTAPNNQAPI